MDNLARNIDGGVAQETGVVQAIDADGTLRVATDGGTVRARRAVSCLVAPAVDDVVLVATRSDGRSWILAVLERKEGECTLTADGDLRVQLPAGRFTVAAQEGVAIASGRDVSVTTARIDVNAVEGHAVVQKLSYLGRFLQTEVEKVKTIAGTFDAVLERFSQRVKRSYRTVEEFDQVRAERIDYVARKNMSLRGENALVTAKQLVKVDGEQIHLG